MRQVGDLKLYTFEEAKDIHFGKIGTPRRDEHERKVADAIYTYRIGETIKKARLEQNLTQEELGKKIGVKRAQISRFEKGYSISLPSMSKIFKALGFNSVSIDFGGSLGRVPIW